MPAAVAVWRGLAVTWTAAGVDDGGDDDDVDGPFVLAGVFAAGAGATQTGRLPAFTGPVTSGGACGAGGAELAGAVVGDGWVVEAGGTGVACAVLDAAAVGGVVVGVAGDGLGRCVVGDAFVAGAVSDIVALPVGQVTGPGFHAGKGLGLV